MELERPQAVHPWKGFARADLHESELDSLPRTLRFAHIQINKFWVEVQSFPLFMKALRTASVEQIGLLLEWLRAAPAWEELLPDARAVPALSRAASRRVLLDFARDVKSVRVLRQYLQSKSRCESVEPLTEASALVRAHSLEAMTQADLAQHITTYRQRLARIRGVMRFFEELSEKTGVPHARNPGEALHLFQLIDCIGRIPAQVVPWRHRQILDPSKRIRIQAWQDRMRPTLEVRKRLETHFKMDESADAEPLRKIAEALTEGGLFRSFKADYKEAVKAYRALLLQPSDRRHSKETPFQMAEKLLEWADHLDQVNGYLENSEAFGFFGDQYRGIDTNFAAALEASAWAAQVREDFDPEISSFAEQLVDFVFDAPKARLDEAFAQGTTSGAETIRGIVGTPEFAEDREFVEFAAEVESKLAELLRLRDLCLEIGLDAQLKLGELEELRLLTDELLFLVRRMESSASLKEWLKSAFRGSDTELRLIETGLQYVRFVETALIPDVLKEFFLTAHGPQRLGENRKLVGPALSNLALVKEHLHRLEVSSGGNARELISGPIPYLMDRLQQALTHPTHLRGWVEQLRREQSGRLDS